MDDDFADWLVSVGFSEAGINGYSALLPPTAGRPPDAAIVELFVDHEGGVVLRQGVSGEPDRTDDLISLTSLEEPVTKWRLSILLRTLGYYHKELG